MKNKKLTPTLYDVAAKAGVSAATVSRYLNGTATVRQSSRDRIKVVIKDLGYVPDGAARALALRRTRMIGALFPSLDNVLFGQFIGPLQRKLSKQGYTLVVASSDFDKEMEYQQLLSLVSNGVDGIMLVGTQHSEDCFKILANKSIPVVLTWTWDDTCEYPQIGFCNATAAASVAKYLCDIGHRKIAMISGELAGNDRASERFRGVKETLTKNGLDILPNGFIECPFGLQAGATGFRRLVTLTDPPSAIICGSDLFALGALFESQRMGIDVPGDISIIGFDDTDLAGCVVPAMTTIRTPRMEMAELTAAFLLATLDGQSPPSRKLNADLIVRESSGPPPTSKTSK